MIVQLYYFSIQKHSSDTLLVSSWNLIIFLTSEGEKKDSDTLLGHKVLKAHDITGHRIDVLIGVTPWIFFLPQCFSKWAFSELSWSGIIWITIEACWAHEAWLPGCIARGTGPSSYCLAKITLPSFVYHPLFFYLFFIFYDSRNDKSFDTCIKFRIWALDKKVKFKLISYVIVSLKGRRQLYFHSSFASYIYTR